MIQQFSQQTLQCMQDASDHGRKESLAAGKRIAPAQSKKAMSLYTRARDNEPPSRKHAAGLAVFRAWQAGAQDAIDKSLECIRSCAIIFGAKSQAAKIDQRQREILRSHKMLVFGEESPTAAIVKLCRKLDRDDLQPLLKSLPVVLTQQEVNAFKRQAIAFDAKLESHQRALEHESPQYWKIQDIKAKLADLINELP